MRSPLLALTVGGAVAAGTVWALNDYRAWRALGPGGLPPTWAGWARTTRWRLAKRDAFALTRPASECDGSVDAAALGDLPLRQGPRPRVAPHPVPHRQLTGRAPPAIRPALAAIFAAHVAADPDRLFWATSHFEKSSRAVTVRPAFRHHHDACSACGEVGHVHASDGSMHMILSPNDARTVIVRGWGERHGLAGFHLGLPATYMMIYAPREEQDLAVISRILGAAARYQSSDPSGAPGEPTN